MQWYFVLLPLLLLLLPTTTDAYITIVDSGKQYSSRPDRSVGERLWKGYEYMGRMQYIHGNLPLCGLSQTWNITPPPDGLPGA